MTPQSVALRAVANRLANATGLAHDGGSTYGPSTSPVFLILATHLSRLLCWGGE